jgi:signal transduction histidine kinase
MRVIEFRIADTGPGVSPALLVKVFEPFFTTKSGGTGLGLAIAQGVVAGHDGRLRLLPRPGGGTIAVVELPLAADPDGVSARVS